MVLKVTYYTLFVLVLCLGIARPIYPQELDSIINSVSELDPESQVRQLIDLSWEYRSSNPAFALECGEAALGICNDNALHHQPELLNIIGVVYRNIGELELSYEYYKKALSLAEEYSDSVQIAYSNNNIGGYYRLIGSYTKAIEYMLKAARVFEKTGDQRGEGFCAINIGILFRRQDEFDKALQYLNRAIEIRRELNDKQGLALALNQLAEIHFQQKKYDQAKKDYENLLELYKEIKEDKGIAAVYAGLAGVYYQLGKYYIALDYRSQAITIDREINNKYGIITNLTNLGRIFTQLKNYQEADKNFSESLRLIKESGYLDLEMELYESYTELYLSKSDYKNAYQYHFKKDIIRDSLFNKEKHEIITDFETAYESDKKELENNILKKNIEYERVLSYSLIIISVLVLVIFGMNWRRIKSHKEANKLLKELNLTKDKFFKILAHDLKNPFNTIMGYSEILVEDFFDLKQEEIHQLIIDINKSSTKLYKLLENLLKWADTQSGTLQQFPENVNPYDSIEDIINLFNNVVSDKKLNVVNTVDKEENVFVDKNSFNFILRNLFNNALKFSKIEGTITFHSPESSDNQFVLAISDNGIGIREEDKQKLFSLEKVHTTVGTGNEVGTGLGLILVKEFVERNGGKIWFESEQDKQTTFYISLPKAVK